MYKRQLSEIIDKKFSKIAKKNPKLLDVLDKKISEILRNPYRYKNLKGSMKGFMRVHINIHFVLIFEVDENSRTVRFLDFDHHDRIYRS